MIPYSSLKLTINSRHERRQRWQKKIELLRGDGLMGLFSTRREGKDDDKFKAQLIPKIYVRLYKSLCFSDHHGEKIIVVASFDNLL